MTLAECIERHEQATATAPRRPAAAGTVTPLGLASVHLYRLKRQLAALTTEERRHLLGQVVIELRLLHECDDPFAVPSCACFTPSSPSAPAGLRLLGCDHAPGCTNVAECHERDA